MYCRNCGKPIPKDGEFCMMCGSPVYTSSPIPTTQKNSPPSIKTNTTRKPKIRALIIILMSIVIISLIAIVILFTLGVLPASVEPKPIIDYDITANDGILQFSVTIEGKHYNNISYEYNDNKSNEILTEDFMNEPINLTLLIKDDEGDPVETLTLQSFMVINTDEDDSIRWKDYNGVKTLLVYDPLGEVEIADLKDLEALEALYLFKFEDAKNLNELSDLRKLTTLSLNTLPLYEFRDIDDFVSLEYLALVNTPMESIKGISNLENLKNLEIINCPISVIDGLDNLEELSYLELRNLNLLESIEVVEDIPSLQALIIKKIFKVSQEDAESIIDHLEDNEVFVEAELLPAYVPSIKKSDVTIGFLNYDSSEYYSYFEDTFAALANQEGINVVIRNSEGTLSKELENAKELLAYGVDALAVISVDSDKSIKVVELANEAGVPIFCLGHPIYIDRDKHEINGDVKEFPSMTAYALGRWVASKYPDASCVNMPLDFAESNSIDLIIGFEQGLIDGGSKPADLIDSVSQSGENAEDSANHLISSGKHFDVIFVSNENSYEAVVKVFDERGIKDKVIVSTNGKEKYWTNISDGYLAATSPNPPSLMADLCLQQIIGYLNGDKYDDYVQVYPTDVLTSDNLYSAIPWEAQSYIEARLTDSIIYDSSHYYSQNVDDYDQLLALLNYMVDHLESQ